MEMTGVDQLYRVRTLEAKAGSTENIFMICLGGNYPAKGPWDVHIDRMHTHVDVMLLV